MTEPCASSTARETMFSDAISSISSRWRCELVADRAGDVRIGLRQGGGEERVFRVGGGGGGLGHGRDVADSREAEQGIT